MQDQFSIKVMPKTVLSVSVTFLFALSAITAAPIKLLQTLISATSIIDHDAPGNTSCAAAAGAAAARTTSGTAAAV
jgi:hypothetical protein